MFNLFKKNYETQVENEFQKLENGMSIDVDNSQSPVKLKKDESYLGSMPVQMGTYKNNGNFKYAAVTARIPIVKGIKLRLGQGKMGFDKSWVYDHPGLLIFTTKRIIFNGDYSNKSIAWSSVLEFAIDSKVDMMLIGSESGKDMAFEVKEWLDPKVMAVICHFNNNGSARKQVA